MSRKVVISLVLAVVLVLSVAVIAFAQTQPYGNGAPMNGARSGMGFGRGGAGMHTQMMGAGFGRGMMGQGYADADGDGVCDHWVDANGDGVNDNAPQDGTGMQYGRHGRWSGTE